MIIFFSLFPQDFEHSLKMDEEINISLELFWVLDVIGRFLYALAKYFNASFGFLADDGIVTFFTF